MRKGARERRFPLLFVGGSALAHLLLVAALVAPWPGWPPAPPPQADTPSSVEVVMVSQPARTQGQPAAAPPTPTPAPPVDTPPVPPQESLVPPPPPPQPPSPAERSAPAVNLGGDPSDPWNVRSDDVHPPAPDARFRNLPPRYPAQAAALGEFGTVGLLIHVAADGTADGVDVVESSGFPALDREARRAVLLWHFAPAQRDGEPVPFDYPFSIHFSRN